MVGQVPLDDRAHRRPDRRRVDPVELQRARVLVRVERDHPERQRVALDEPARRDHLADVEARALLAAQPAEPGVGDARHRRQHDRGVAAVRTDLQRPGRGGRGGGHGSIVPAVPGARVAGTHTEDSLVHGGSIETAEDPPTPPVPPSAPGPAARRLTSPYGDRVADGRLVTTAELARALGLSARTIQRYRQGGLLVPDAGVRGRPRALGRREGAQPAAVAGGAARVVAARVRRSRCPSGVALRAFAVLTAVRASYAIDGVARESTRWAVTGLARRRRPARSGLSAAAASWFSEHGHRVVGTPRPAVPQPLPRQKPCLVRPVLAQQVRHDVRHRRDLGDDARPQLLRRRRSPASACPVQRASAPPLRGATQSRNTDTVALISLPQQ